MMGEPGEDGIPGRKGPPGMKVGFTMSCTCVCMCVCTCVCMSVCVSACVCLCLHTLCCVLHFKQYRLSHVMLILFRVKKVKMVQKVPRE